MGIQERLQILKCKTKTHLGDWLLVAPETCGEQRTCPACGDVAVRTAHHLSEWVFYTHEAPPCTAWRRCARCGYAETDLRHDMQVTYLSDVPNPNRGYDQSGRWIPPAHIPRGVCVQGNVCKRCGYLPGKAAVLHRFMPDRVFRDRNNMEKTVHKCRICGHEVVMSGMSSPNPSR